MVVGELQRTVKDLKKDFEELKEENKLLRKKYDSLLSIVEVRQNLPTTSSPLQPPNEGGASTLPFAFTSPYMPDPNPSTSGYLCNPYHQSAGPLHQFTSCQPPTTPYHSYQGVTSPIGPDQATVGSTTPSPIQFSSKSASLPSTSIQKSQLREPDEVLRQYYKLKTECKIGTLAVKLAREAFFGPEVLAKCTVVGCRELPALPIEEVQQLKKFLFAQFPTYWKNVAGFESLWAICVTSINQCCKLLRNNSRRLNY